MLFQIDIQAHTTIRDSHSNFSTALRICLQLAASAYLLHWPTLQILLFRQLYDYLYIHIHFNILC